MRCGYSLKRRFPMAVIRLDKSKTVLLMADFHADGMEQNPMVKERRTLERAREVLAAARDAGVFWPTS
jgi:hypothetical protein